MWKKPPQNLTLNNDEVHVWLINIKNFIKYLDFLTSILSEEELNRSQRYYKKELQNNFIINRGCLRYILAKYLLLNAEDIKFNYNMKGKPFLGNINSNNIQFNLSHTQNYIVYGISYLNLGIDLEKIKLEVKVKDIAKRFFTQDEYDDICKLNTIEQSEYFFQLWTAKESYLKAIGEGLSAGLDSINLSKNINQTQWDIKLIKSSIINPKRWQITTLKILENYLMSLALLNNNKSIIKYYTIDF